MTHHVTVLADLGTPAEVWGPMPFRDYAALLSDPPSARLPMVWGATFAGRRTNATCMGRSILAIDVDGDHGTLTVRQALERCHQLGVAAMAHTTRRSTPSAPRLRVLVELAGSVPNDKAWKATVWPWVQRNWPEHDASGKDIARFSWGPQADKDYQYEALESGAPLRWVDLVPPAADHPAAAGAWIGVVYPHPAPGPTADLVRRLAANWPPSGRHFTHMAVAGWLAKHGFPHPWVEEVIAGVCGATGADDRTWNRLQMVVSTYEKLSAGGYVSGHEWLRREAPAILGTLDAFESAHASKCLRRLKG